MFKFASGVLGLAILTGLSAGFFLNNFPTDIRSEKSGETTSEASPSLKKTSREATLATSNSNSQSNTQAYDGRYTKIRADQRGHFITKARMNGRQIKVLVDTGATSVAINAKTARKLGIKLKQSDYKYTVNTANGSIKAASAMIDRIEIGRVKVRNVRTAVLPDSSLNDTLLGMSFLKELHSFEVKSGELVLRQ